MKRNVQNSLAIGSRAEKTILPVNRHRDVLGGFRGQRPRTEDVSDLPLLFCQILHGELNALAFEIDRQCMRENRLSTDRLDDHVSVPPRRLPDQLTGRATSISENEIIN